MTLSEQVSELEQENVRLNRLVDALTEEIEGMKIEASAKEMELAKDRLIDLVEPSILWQEKHLGRMASIPREEMGEIVAAYRAIRPEGGATCEER